jgi:hypothetical protein
MVIQPSPMSCRIVIRAEKENQRMINFSRAIKWQTINISKCAKLSQENSRQAN